MAIMVKKRLIRTSFVSLSILQYNSTELIAGLFKIAAYCLGFAEFRRETV